MRALLGGLVIPLLGVAVLLATSGAAPAGPLTLAPPPGNLSPPFVAGVAQDGQVLSADPGSWVSADAVSYAFQWQRCDATGVVCVDVAGATAQTFGLTAADVGSTVLVVVTASNASGAGVARSAAAGPVVAAPPAVVKWPKVSGVAQSGQVLSGSTGTWTGTPPLGFTFQWRRCDATGASCVDVAVATGPTYTVTDADVGATLRLRVFASNAAGMTYQSSIPTATVTAAPPVVVKWPKVTGVAQSGQVLSGTTGTWTGTQPLIFAFQWRRCDAAVTACIDIAGATGQTYKVTDADVGSLLRLRVFATNAAGTAYQGSSPTSQVVGPQPYSASPPAVSGIAQDGQVLTADPGTWVSPDTVSLAFRWRRCDVTGLVCVDVPGATAQTYPLTPADVGSLVLVVVTASNASGSGVASSTTVGPVAAAPPAVVKWPRVTGAAQSGQVLTGSTGTWSGTPPLSFAFQWRRCDATGAACGDIAGATARTYTLTDADIGSTVRLRVFASNAVGTSYQSSPPSALVTPAPSAPCGWSSAAPPVTYDHVIWIVMENRSYSQIIGSTDAPYINGVASACGVATNFTAAASLSLPSYIAMTSGSTQGITDSGSPAVHPLAVESIFSQLSGDWRALEESMPSNCYPVDADLYVVRHNPAAYYTSIADQCATNDVALSGPLDLRARFTFVTPNLCDDMHLCPTTPDTSSQTRAGDAWLAAFLPKILGSPQYEAGSTAVFITWDEGSNYEKHIPTIVISPYTPAGTVSDVAFSHYSLLRTAEELLGVGTYLGQAATTESMRRAFHL